MTKVFPFIAKLKALLPESSWSWVIPALAQDRNIWNALQDPGFGELALDRIGSKAKNWTPGNLALLHFDQNSYSDPVSLDARIRKNALHAYESILKGQSDATPNQDFLIQAFLIAVALLEHRHLSGSWNSLPADLNPVPLNHWDTILACLYGLASDSSALLNILISYSSPMSLRRSGLHALLSNPQTPTEQIQILHEILSSQPMPEWLPVLQELEQSRPKLTAELARNLLTKQAIFANHKSYQENSKQVKHLTYLLAMSELQRMAGEKDQGQTLHYLALDAAKDLHAQLSHQIIDVSVRTGNLNEAVSQWKEMVATLPVEKTAGYDFTPPNNLILSFLEENRIAEAMDLIQSAAFDATTFRYPAYHLVKAHQAAYEGDLSTARKAAKQALIEASDPENESIERINQGSIYNRNEKSTIESQHLLKLIAQTLIDLDLPEQALNAANKLNDLQPNNPDTLITLAQSQCAARQTDQAVINAHLAAALEANCYNRQHQLALFLEASDQWEEALAEWQSLLDDSECKNSHDEWPPLSILHSAANCAIRAGDLDLAFDLCQQILNRRPEDGIANSLIGEKLILQGDVRTALVHYQQGTELEPDLAFPWLRMANAQKEKGLPGNPIETLRQAAQAVPGDPAVHLALAELYLKENALTQALTSLQHAHGLVTQPLLVSKSNPWELKRQNQQITITVGDPLSCRVAMRLGETLRLLGHLDDARQLLEDSYQDYPGSVELAGIYSKTLLALGEYENAIEPLRKVVNSEPIELEPYLDYAGALIHQNLDPSEAVNVLHKAEKIFPNDPHITAFLAEALGESEDLEASQQHYYQALQSDLVNEAEWHSKLSFGLGKVSLKLSQPETAIASLQESIQTKQDNPQAHRVLAEAYASLDLNDEALESARIAMNQSADDPDLLNWFANLSAQLNSLDEAIATLIRYVEIRPEDIGILVKLGKIQSKAGKENDALITLKSILSKQGADVDHYRQAASVLLNLKDPDSAATFLERAIQQQTDTDPTLLLELATAYQLAGRPQQALESLDNAIHKDPSKAHFFLVKANLLSELGRAEDVLNCLDEALKLHPENQEIMHHLILHLRAFGEISLALSHAIKLVATTRKDPSLTDVYSARTLAADLARSMLQPEYARSFLTITRSEEASGDSLNNQYKETSQIDISGQYTDNNKDKKITYRSEASTLFSYYCLSAELALEEGEEVSAAEALNQAIEYYPAHPRLLALQARLANRRGDSVEADEILRNTLDFLSKDDQWSKLIDTQDQRSKNGNSAEERVQDQKKVLSPRTLYQKQDFVCTLFGIGLAAIELGQWDTALNMLQKAVKETPEEPYTQLQMARALVLRAEYQRLCQTLDVVEHAPGESAVGKDSHKSFQNVMQVLSKRLSENRTTIHDNGNQIISHWLRRGQIAFQAQEQANQAVSSISKNLESVLEIDTEAKTTSEAYIDLEYEDKSKDPLQHSLSLAHLAVTSLRKNNQKITDDQGYRAAQSALSHQPKQPIFHTLVAYLAKHSGDHTTALNSMLTALSMWSDEPRWQAIIAELYMESGDTQAAIDHLHKAVELEPGFMKHHLAIGEAYLQNGDHQLAIQSLKQAHRLSPDELHPNLALARAYIMDQDPTNATTYAEHALKLASDRPEPMQLLAEIALLSGEPKTALNRANVALDLDPERPETLCLLARAMRKLNQYDEALSVLETAIPLTAEPLPILLERAKLLEVSQGSAVALQALQDLVKDYPDDPGIQASLARNLATEGQNQEAIQAAQKALHGRDGNWEPGEQATLYLLLGSLLRQAGQLDQAIHHLTEAIRLAPQDVAPYLELAATQQDRRQHIQALQTYQKAMDIAPDNPLPYYHASLALKDGRDYEGAERMLRKAASLAPEDVSIHRQLAALVALNLVHNRSSVSIEA